MGVTEFELDGIDGDIAIEIQRIQRWVELVAPIGGDLKRRFVFDPDQTVDIRTMPLGPDGTETRIGPAFLADLSKVTGGTFAGQIAGKLVRENAAVRLGQLDASNDMRLADQVAKVFGPHFQASDLKEATRLDPSDVSEIPMYRRDAIALAVSRQLEAHMIDGVSHALATAWGMYLSHTWRPHLAREFGAILETAYQDAFPETVTVLQDAAVVQAREALQQLLEGTYWVPKGVTRSHPPRRDALARIQQLANDPTRIEDGKVESDATVERKKFELFEILQLLSNVVNADVRRFLAAGGELEGKLSELAPFQPATSSLASDNWAGAIKRAADLIKQLPSETHSDILDRKSTDLEIVLDDIEQGYEAITGEDDVIKAAEYVVLAADSFVSHDQLREIIANSKSLTVHQAGGNLFALNAARAALALAENDEGSYEPVTVGFVHSSNLVYDPHRRHVTYRKSLSDFEIPKSTDAYVSTLTDVGSLEVEPTIGDVVTDDIGSTVTLACPGLTPITRTELAPLPDALQERVRRAHDTRWVKHLPSRTFTTIPEDLWRIIDHESGFRAVEVQDIPGVRVVVRRTEGYTTVSGDDAALDGIRWERDDNGTLRVIGSGDVGQEVPENRQDWPLLEIRLLGGQKPFDFDCSGVDDLCVHGARLANISMPEDGYLFVAAEVAKLEVGARNTVVAAPSRDCVQEQIDIDAPGVESDRDLSTLTVFTRGYPLPATTTRGGIATSNVEPQYAAYDRPLWEVTADELPDEIREKLDRGPEWIKTDVLQLPDETEVVRNRLTNRVSAISERFQGEDHVFDRVHNRCISAITLEAMSNPAFLAGLMEASEDPSISVSSRLVFSVMTRVAASDHDYDQEARDMLNDPERIYESHWGSPLDYAYLDWREDLDATLKDIADAADPTEVAARVDQLEARATAELPLRPIDRFFEDLGRVTTDEFDAPRAMVSLLNPDEMSAVLPSLKLEERRVERQRAAARARAAESRARRKQAGSRVQRVPDTGTHNRRDATSGAPETQESAERAPTGGRQVDGRPGTAAKRGSSVKGRDGAGQMSRQTPRPAPGQDVTERNQRGQVNAAASQAPAPPER